MSNWILIPRTGRLSILGQVVLQSGSYDYITAIGKPFGAPWGTVDTHMHGLSVSSRVFEVCPSIRSDWVCIWRQRPDSHRTSVLGLCWVSDTAVTLIQKYCRFRHAKLNSRDITNLQSYRTLARYSPVANRARPTSIV